jgi:hypothetical protein
MIAAWEAAGIWWPFRALSWAKGGGATLSGRACFHGGSPLFPARYGALVVRTGPIHSAACSVQGFSPGGRTAVGHMKVRFCSMAVSWCCCAEDGRAAPPTTRPSVGASKLRMPTLKRLYAVR